ncbi:hypothetical protein Tco_0705395 [Tanacetum coccineum]|uniref:Uncharacterized protein n=1 Tax=Tanacetum coccineum TaxID=301880 RepID=A0ABQ4Y4H7_9ASTR
MIKFYNLCTNLVDFADVAPLPPRDQSHLWLRYQVVGYTEEIVHNFKQRLETIFRMIGSEMGLDVADTLCFQLGRARRNITWRQFILALGLHIAEEMAEDGFGVYWLGSERVIPDKGDLSDYWVEISFGGDFLRGSPSYTYIKDPVRRLCHRCLAHHFGMVSDDRLRGLSVVTHEIPLINMGELVKLNICKEIGDDWAWVAPEPERQQVVVDGAPEAENAPAIDEGA